jgi:small-conductance mechanosensitive channel
LLLALVSSTSICAAAVAADEDETRPAETAQAPASDEPAPATAGRVDVAGVAEDHEIAARLERILDATGWFQNHAVRVEQGVVSLTGTTKDERHRVWATDLARRTEDVVAVVNRMEVEVPAAELWRPALQGLQSTWSGFLRSSPGMLLGAMLAALAYLAGRGATSAFRARARQRDADVVRELRARAAGILVFVLGIYIALRIAGLTRLAATVLGGTGVVGLVLGIAFRDIAENVLASLLLTRQQPFRKGDLVEIAGIEGYVQRLTLRATILMNLEGNHVQIPNSTVYKSPIRNFTSNPARRVDFVVGIGYADSIAHAQEVARGLITQHPAVLDQPEPWVLAESLGSAVVQLRVYVWLDGTKHSWLKVRSSIIRLIKRGFQEHGISMPDEAREVVFPDGVPVHIMRDGRARSPQARASDDNAATLVEQRRRSGNDAAVATGAEARLDSEAGSIERLADAARTPEGGKDLLTRR